MSEGGVSALYTQRNKKGMVGEDSDPSKGKGTELFRSGWAPGVTSFIWNMGSGKGEEGEKIRGVEEMTPCPRGASSSMGSQV